MEIHEKVSDTRSKIASTQKVLKDIAKKMVTDKCIICLICLVVIAILFLIIYGALGMDEENNFNTPDDTLD